jgi:hypothetical protein
MLNFFVKDFLLLNKKIKILSPHVLRSKTTRRGFIPLRDYLIPHVLFLYFLIFYILTTVRSKYIKKLALGHPRYYKQAVQIPKKPFSPQENFC